MIRLKLWPCLLLLIFSLANSYADFEDCQLIQANVMQPMISLSVTGADGQNTVTIELFEDNQNKRVFKSIDAKGEYFTAFVCHAQNDSTDKSADSLEPCKQYIHYTESQSESFRDSLLCFRTFNSSVQKTSAIIIVNRMHSSDPNIFLKLAETNSYIQDSRFLFSVAKFMTETLDDLVPILEHSSLLFWLRPENLIVEHASDGRMYFRYRYIDTNAIGSISREQKKKAIHSIFFMLKLFMFKSKSCKDIVEQARSTLYYNAFTLDPSYPKNFQVVLEWLDSKECEVKESLALTTNEKHEILLRLAAIAYCQKKVTYDLESLKALKEMIGFIFNEDAVFLSFTAQSKFKATFQEKSANLVPEDYTNNNRVYKNSEKVKKTLENISSEPILDKIKQM